ncbi:RNA polymerase sigma factor [Aliikangiella coralliicola]|uniref:Sigma-70 family RNA polymerase sigma factor n=1 Tax=Aliikangiella coralliicola TaxID=2592383 RepID=A0A545U0E7_9GAMM|nr:sigma-70 family RNA polymerase sigma factor [Aliikangiella coralliicola]TQV82942.1 sigma-70 family RNA polymerase sigma factor [Aliikangiella coralliicola]
MDTSFKTNDLSENLVTQIANGVKAAEQKLVDQYWRGLYFILNRRTNDPDLSADLAQDTFIVVIESARKGKIENPDALSGYIRQVGVNLMIAHYRKEKRRATQTESDIQVYAPDDSPSLYRCIHSEKMLEKVQQLVDEMTVERDRLLLKSYYLEEKDKKDICSELDLTPQHFDRVLFRARTRLKQLILMNISTGSSNPSSQEILSIVFVFIVVSSGTYEAHYDNSKNFQTLLRDIGGAQHLMGKNVNGFTFNSDRSQHRKPMLVE